MAAIEIVEVSPRDGLQNEKTLLSTADKLTLIDRAIAAGVRRMEVASFVNPKKVPQMADAEAVMSGLPARADVTYVGLALNDRGFSRALQAGVDEVNFAVMASDTFNQRNQGADAFETIGQLETIAARARGAVPVGVTVGTAFGCPFEGEIPVDRLLSIVDALAAIAPREIALADTIGVATPRDVARRVGAVRARFPKIPIRCHFHNTRNTGIANAWAAIEAGAATLDASLGGVGGCPFAPAATGNIATEDLVYMLDRAGIETGLDLEACIGAARWLEEALGHSLPGQVMKAGGFPDVA
ncbi:hydroxymethylglutaryl-CoA lyase [Roseitalea porphyridii]|uniref:Hydroxymethylglutaryl-CoA lyase n=1 Tax=Roseitalea porphyridii TaxID=1852022 RepID=A0A4V1A423_9HYPH|nr:hydroxymethylglutaryl-CoA lyase [Roseitalea porphyridii]QBK31118.1 hydroxymethylglutaryl-CoA lyase [Roseitalea porphyridii]